MTRLTVAAAFDTAGLTLPSTHTKSNTTNRGGTPCIRSVQQQAFTVTASHPRTWADAQGTTVRCLNVQESALLMGFTPTWKLPEGSRLGIHGVGNAVPPPMAAAIMRCAIKAARGLADMGSHKHNTTLPPTTTGRVVHSTGAAKGVRGEIRTQYGSERAWLIWPREASLYRLPASKKARLASIMHLPSATTEASDVVSLC